ncbi:MAG: PIN domain-containing protein [Cyclobacteriaceae bacterium]
MVTKIFADSDVIIDFLTDRHPYSEEASKLIQLNHIKKIQLYISSLSVSNIYNVTRKSLGHKKSIGVIALLIETIEIIGTNKQGILHALDSGFSDFEDGIQHATALSVEGIEAIVTRNVKDYKKSKIAVITPSDFVKTIDIN